MQRRPIVKCPNGFTLVEVLLGLVIAAIIGLCVYNMFWLAMKLDDKMRHIHDTYMEVLMADQALTRDLENAISLDFSGSYPDTVVFEGQSQEFSFLTQTPKGIERVTYYSGMPNEGPATQTMIGRVTNPSKTYSREALPIEFLIRQQSSLADWLKQTTDHTSTKVVAAGLEKGSFNCQYAAWVKDLHASGATAIVYKDSWDDKGLPMSVSCSFKLYDFKNPEEGLTFKRDIFLAPVTSYYNEQ